MSQLGSDNETSKPKKNPVQISKDILFRLMGGYSQGDIETNISKAYPTKISFNELTSQIRKNYVKPETPDKLNQQGLITFVQPIHEQIAKSKFESNRFRILAPEIEQASLILISSILSPNDLQTTQIKFTVNHEKLTNATKKRIEDILSSYFNSTLDLGLMLQDWIKQCLFKTGSQPILVLPESKFNELKTRTFNNISNSQFSTIGSESRISNNSNLESYINELCNKSIYNTQNKSKPYELLNSCFSLATENKQFIIKDKTIVSNFIKELEPEFRSILENDFAKLYPITENMTLHVKQLMETERTKVVNNLLAGVEKTTVNIITQMNDGDVFRITENPEILRFHSNYSLTRKYNLSKKLDSFYGNDDNEVYANEPITPISAESDSDIKYSKFYPMMMILPPESVIPICIPGDKKNHIGYFIVLDQFGHPIIAEDDELDNTMCGNGKGAKAFNLMFGSGSQTGLFKLSDITNTNLVSKVFEHILDKYLHAKLNDIGIGDMEISQYNSISQVMFRRLMFHKKTILVFVPSSFITYYAFDYRDNGTGKSKLDDISFILHLRTTFFIARILAMMKDAIDHKTVTVELDEKVANPEQLLQQIKDLFIAQQSMIFNSNPADIVRTISDRSLSIQARNYPGLQNFNVETNQTQNSTTSPDDQLLETLNSLFIDFLDVPHSALNQLSENEYSRSIVSNHLFFAKKIINYQKILNSHNNKFVQLYTKYAKPLRDAISNIINKDGSGGEVVKTIDNKDSGKISINEIINSITTELPTPKIAPDKAQYNEINDYINSLSSVIDSLYPDDIVNNNDSDAREAIGLLRAFYKAKAVEKLNNIIGINNIFELPNLNESTEAQIQLTDIYQLTKNLRNQMLSAKSVLDKYEDPEENFSGESSGDSGDFGGDDFGGDLGGDDLGGSLEDDLGGEDNLDEEIANIDEGSNDENIDKELGV